MRITHLAHIIGRFCAVAVASKAVNSSAAEISRFIMRVICIILQNVDLRLFLYRLVHIC